MPLKPIRFSSLQDVYDLFDKLKTLGLLTFNSDMTQVQVLNLAALKAQFIVGDDYETYLLSDIFQLSNEEMLASQVTFSARPNQLKKEISINKHRILLQDHNGTLLHNYPLVDALCQINPNKEQLLNLQMPINPSTHIPIVFPLLNHEERAVDGFETIKDVLASNKKIEMEPGSPEALRTVRWHIPNLALAELQRLSYQQMQAAPVDVNRRTQLRQTYERVALVIKSVDMFFSGFTNSLKPLSLADKKDNEALMTRIDNQYKMLQKHREVRRGWYVAAACTLISAVASPLSPEFLVVALVYERIVSKDKNELRRLFAEFNNEQLAKINTFIVTPMREHLQFFLDRPEATATASKSSSPLQQLSLLNRKSGEHPSASEQSSFTATL